MSSKEARKRKVVIYLPDLSGGGAERLHLRLAPVFHAAGLDVTLLLDERKGELVGQVPDGIHVVELKATRQAKAIFKLIRYLRHARPDVLIANMEHMNVMAVIARFVSCVRTRIIVTQHIALSGQIKRPSLKFRALPLLYRIVLPFADRIVAVSGGVAEDLALHSGLRRDRMTVVYNGVVADEFVNRSMELPSISPWENQDLPVVMGMGRFVPQKDFPTLLKAFAKVVESVDSRLLLLGDGPMREELEKLSTQLGILDKVAMPGFVDNPLPLVKNASAFVLSSRFEGFGNVIAEALACGTPVVSTNCPHGPAEILANGKYGKLVPVGDVDALACAISDTLQSTSDRAFLQQRGRTFSVQNCASEYLELIQ